MELYVVRHAIAEDRREDLAEADRELTDEGRERFRGVVRGLRALDVRFDVVLHSPWTRAAQTAEMLRPVAAQLEATDALARGPTPALLRLIATRGEHGVVAVVGHQPWLGELFGGLVFGDDALGARLDLKKGGVLRLEGRARARGMRLLAALTPRQLRAMR